jgi:hypothetical protein
MRIAIHLPERCTGFRSVRQLLPNSGRNDVLDNCRSTHLAVLICCQASAGLLFKARGNLQAVMTELRLLEVALTTQDRTVASSARPRSP